MEPQNLGDIEEYVIGFFGYPITYNKPTTIERITNILKIIFSRNSNVLVIKKRY